MRLRRILTALADGEVDLEDPVEPRRGDFCERTLHSVIRAFLSVERDFENQETLTRLFHFARDIGFLVGWVREGQLNWDPRLRRLVEVFLKDSDHPSGRVVAAR